MNEIELTGLEIECLFEGTNFGGSEQTNVGRRGLMSDGVLKIASGYFIGKTLNKICRDAGLITNSFGSTKAGVRWAFMQIYKTNSYTTLERLNKIHPVKR